MSDLKLCKNCKLHKFFGEDKALPEDHYCTRLLKPNKINLVTGDIIEPFHDNYLRCAHERDPWSAPYGIDNQPPLLRIAYTDVYNNTACGPTGNYYQPKDD